MNKLKTWWQKNRYFGEKVYTPYEYLRTSGFAIIVIGLIFLLITFFINWNIKNLILSLIVVFFGIFLIWILEVMRKRYKSESK